MKKIGEGIYINVSPEKITITKSLSLWSKIILLIGFVVSIMYWRNDFLTGGMIFLNILGSLHREHIEIDIKNKILNQYSKLLFCKYFEKKQLFTGSVKFDVRREEFGDADMGLRTAYALYFKSNFEKSILQFDFSDTGEKLLTILSSSSPSAH